MVGRDVGNLYLNSGNPGKGIESNNIIKMKRRIAYDKNNRRN